MIRRRTAHAIAAMLAGNSIAFCLTEQVVLAGIVLSIEASIVVWSIESSRNTHPATPEKRS